MFEFLCLTVLCGSRDSEAIFRYFLTCRFVLRVFNDGFDARAQDFADVERMDAMGDVLVFIRHSMSPSDTPGANAMGEGSVFDLTIRFTRGCIRALLFFYFFLMINDGFTDVFDRHAICIRRRVAFCVFLVFYVHVFCVLGIRYDGGLLFDIRLRVLILYFSR